MTWQLPVSKDKLEWVYKAHPEIDLSLFEREPESDEDMIANFLPSKLWRLNNLYTIVNKFGERIPFEMNLSQHRVYAASLAHPRLIILKSRQQGISTFWLISYFDDAILLNDLNVGLMAQGKSEASTLLKRVQLAYDTLPHSYIELIGLVKLKDTGEEQGYSTASTIFIRTSFRSATLQRLHISEYGKICKAYPEKAKEVKTGTLQAIAPGNTVVIESTAEGHNDFKVMWDTSVNDLSRYQARNQPLPGKAFYPVFLSWLDDPDCVSHIHEPLSLSQEEYFAELEETTGRVITQEQRNFWVQQYAELGESTYQEYPATPEEAFTKVNNGAYWAVQYTARVINRARKVPDLYDENLPVYVALDLGVDDLFVLVYFQYYAGAYRVIDEYVNSNEGLEHYANHLLESPYHINLVYCPHDIQARELGMNKTRLARFHELGITNTIVLPRSSVADGIEEVRKLIPNLWIDEKCTYLDGCFLNYSREWDDKLETWKSSPRHDKWSHGADALRYMAMADPSGHTIVEEWEAQRRDRGPVADGMAF